MKTLASALLAAGVLLSLTQIASAHPETRCEKRSGDLAFLIKSALAQEPGVQDFGKINPTEDGLALSSRQDKTVTIHADALRKYDFAVVPRPSGGFSLLDLQAQDDPQLASCAFLNNDHGALGWALDRGVRDAAGYQDRAKKIGDALSR